RQFRQTTTFKSSELHWGGCALMSTSGATPVLRSVLLPLLDKNDVIEKTDNPTPTGSHWLFQPPPYVSGADLIGERIIISNPSLLSGAAVGGYTLRARSARHTFIFPEGAVIPPQGSITVYCSPGHLSKEELRGVGKGDLLWLNQDGTLRRKEVLNNNGEEITLADRRGRDLASLMVHPDPNPRSPGAGGNGYGDMDGEEEDDEEWEWER
ncbi:unnamed protein product, partial [Discosporangium mesarthrocarpum]